MSDDIVKRLRVQANRRSGCAHMMSDGSIKWNPMLDEAADEIERLRALLHDTSAILKEVTRALSWSEEGPRLVDAADMLARIDAALNEGGGK